jgi:hypothetical protein
MDKVWDRRKTIDMPLGKPSFAVTHEMRNNRSNLQNRLNIVWQYIIGVNENIVHPEPLKNERRTD